MKKKIQKGGKIYGSGSFGTVYDLEDASDIIKTQVYVYRYAEPKIEKHTLKTFLKAHNDIVFKNMPRNSASQNEINNMIFVHNNNIPNNICHPELYSFETTSTVYANVFILMKQMDGTLYDFINNEVKYHPEYSVYLLKAFYSVSDFLRNLHKVFKTHRDLKPQNVMYKKVTDGDVVDFQFCVGDYGAMDNLNAPLKQLTPMYTCPALFLDKSSFLSYVNTSLINIKDYETIWDTWNSIKVDLQNKNRLMIANDYYAMNLMFSELFKFVGYSYDTSNIYNPEADKSLLSAQEEQYNACKFLDHYLKSQKQDLQKFMIPLLSTIHAQKIPPMRIVQNNQLYNLPEYILNHIPPDLWNFTARDMTFIRDMNNHMIDTSLQEHEKYIVNNPTVSGEKMFDIVSYLNRYQVLAVSNFPEFLQDDMRYLIGCNSIYLEMLLDGKTYIGLTGGRKARRA